MSSATRWPASQKAWTPLLSRESVGHSFNTPVTLQGQAPCPLLQAAAPEELRLVDLYADLVLEIEGEAIPVHRAVLAARSRFFRKALRRQWRSEVHCWTAPSCVCSTCAASGGRQPLLPCSLRRWAQCSQVGAAWQVWQPTTGPCNLCIISALRTTCGDVAHGSVQPPHGRPCHALLQPCTLRRPAAAPAGRSLQGRPPRSKGPHRSQPQGRPRLLLHRSDSCNRSGHMFCASSALVCLHALAAA